MKRKSEVSAGGRAGGRRQGCLAAVSVLPRKLGKMHTASLAQGRELVTMQPIAAREG
jgi:hypothetical protein